MHLIKYLILVLLLFAFNPKANSSVYIVDNYVFDTSFDKVKKNREKVIEEIKKQSLIDFLKSITTSSDFKNINIKSNFSEYIKTFVIKNEIKNNQNYKLISKVEFSQSMIEDLLNTKNIKFINYKSNPILTIIVSKKNNNIEIFSIKDFEQDWNSYSNNLLNFFELSGDLKDMSMLNKIDVKFYEASQFNLITENYGVRDYIFILFDYDLSNQVDNVFVRYQFNELKFFQKYTLKSFSKNEINTFLEKIREELNNSWKEIQILSPKKNNVLDFSYSLKTLNDYIEINQILKNNKNIIFIEDLEITNQKYLAKVYLSTNLEVFKESLNQQGLILNNNVDRKFTLEKK